MIKVQVDMDLCQNYGQCAFEAPRGVPPRRRRQARVHHGRRRRRARQHRERRGRLSDAGHPDRGVTGRPSPHRRRLDGCPPHRRVAAQGRVRGSDPGDLGEEPHAPYNRPPLSKDVLAEVVTHEAVAFPSRPATADVDWRLGARATGLDLGSRTVTTADGDGHHYGALVIATGLRPRRLAVDPLPGRHVVRTLDDAMALRAELRAGCSRGHRRLRLHRLRGGGDRHEARLRGHRRQPEHRADGRARSASSSRRRCGGGTRSTACEFRLGRTVADLTGDGPARDRRARRRHRAAGRRRRRGDRRHGQRRVADRQRARSRRRCARRQCAAGGHRPTARALDDVYVVGDIARFPNPMFDEVPRRIEHWNIPTDTGRRAGAVLARAPRGRRQLRAGGGGAVRARCPRSGRTSSTCRCRRTGCRRSPTTCASWTATSRAT